MRRALLSLVTIVASAVTSCGPPAATSVLPRADELGAGFTSIEFADDPAKDAAWITAFDAWYMLESRGPDARQAASERVRALAAAAGVQPQRAAAACLAVGGLHEPASPSERGAWQNITTGNDGLFASEPAGIVACLPRTYVRGQDGNTLRLDVLLVVGENAEALAEIAHVNVDDTSLTELLPTLAALAGAASASTENDALAEQRVLQALTDGTATADKVDPDRAALDVVARTASETVVTARTLGVGDASHAVFVAEREIGIVREKRGVAVIRVGRAVFVVGIQAHGAEAGWIESDLPALAVRLAARAATLGESQ